MKLLQFASFLLIMMVFSCKNETKKATELEQIYSLIKTDYAPDKRVELFDINFTTEKKQLILKGETTSKKALSVLLDSLTNRKLNFANMVRVLPDTAVGMQQFAVARNSVINIRSNPKHSAELATQGLLGMPLKVLDKDGDFYRVQTPDKYISWVDKGGITRMNAQEFTTWYSSEKVLFNTNFGYVYATKNTDAAIVSDISLGGLLQYIGEDASFYEVRYPDDRRGFIKKPEAIRYADWLQNLQPSKENVEKLARSMDGFPYLWGGTSAKGMDCSGFTKIVYLLNGFVIPRDASQQIHVGKIVDVHVNFTDLQKGDLLFFGTKATENKKQSVVHVGIWLGNGKQEFIHASGNVHISSMDKTQPNFDAFNKNRYLGSRRYLGVDDKNIYNLKIEF